MKILDQEKMERIKALLKTHPRGLSITNLASITGMNRNLIAKYLDMLVISGQVEIQQYGPAKVFFLSQRIPVSAMIEITSDLVMVLDQDRKIIHVNKPFTQFLALKREDLIGKTIGEVGHPFLSSIPLPEPAAPLDTREGGIIEVRYAAATGECFFRIKRAPAVFEDGAVGLTLIIEDITEQRRYQENLRLSEARYRGIVQDQTEFINRYLPDTTLTFVNEAVCQYLNCRQEDLVGKRFIEMLPEEERQGVQKAIGALSPQNSTGVLEHRMMDGRGQMRWVHWTNRAIFDDRGVIREFQGMGRDITDQRETAERISRYILQLEFISRKAVEFVHSGPGDDLYVTIARGVKSLCPEAGVCVLSSEGEGGRMKVAAVLDDEVRNRIRGIIGRDLVGMQISPAEEIMEKIQDGILHRVPGDHFSRCLPSPTPEELARLKESFGNVDSYIMGLTHGKDLFGGVLLTLREGVLLQHEHLLMTYLNQASVAVQRQIFQEELRRSREEYRRIVENAEEGIWVLDRDYRTTFANPRLGTMLGYSPGELSGRQIEEFMLPEDIPAHHERIIERKSGVSGRFEQRFRRKDGSLIWTVANATPLMEGGEFAGAVAIVTDITEQKEAGDALRESEGKYRTLVEQAHDMIVVVQDGIMKYCNRKVAEMWGGDVQEIVGQPYDNFIDPDELPRIREIYLRRMAGEEAPQLYDTVLVRRDGSRVHADLGAGTITYGGRPADLIVLRDITEKKEAEEQLKKAHDLQQAILNASPVGIGVTTGQTLTWANRTMDLILGTEEGELKGQPSRVLFADDGEYERALVELRQGVEARGVGTVQTVWKRKDGTRLDIALSIAPVRPGSPEIVAVAHDITDRKRIEEELRRTSALQEAILSASPVGIGVRSGEVMIWGNEAMHRIHGYSREELEGQPARMMYEDEGEYQRVNREIFGAMESGQFRELETVWRKKDGSRVEISLNVGPIRPGSPEILAMVQDITARKEATKELKKSHALQQAILNASPVGIGLISGRLLKWENKAMQRILGTGEGDLKDQPLSIIFTDELEYERVSRELDRAIEQRGSGEVETVWKRRDGSMAEVALRVAPIQAGSPDFIGVATDITNQKQSERALRESEETFRTMVSINPIPLSLIGAGGKYLHVNPAFTRLFGYTLEDIPDGETWFTKAFPDEEQREVAIRLWKADAADHPVGEVRPRTFRVRCRDGSSRDILFLPAATPAGLQVVVYQDITGEKIHARLRESEDLYRHLVEDLNIGIYRSTGDPDGRFIWGNTGLISILGFEDLADLQGIPVRDLFQKPGGRKALLRELQEKKFVKNRLLSLRKKDGTPVKVSVTALAEFDEKGNVRFITGLVQEAGEKGSPSLGAGST